MKKILIPVLILLVAHGVSNAQSSVLKINLFSPLVKTINVQYETKLSAQSSGQLGFFYTGYSTGGTKFSGFGVTPEYRFYLSETEAPAGFYVAPFLRYQSFTVTEDSSNDKGTFSAFGGGLTIGKQWIFKEKIALDIFLGPAYYSGSTKVTSGSGSNFDTGIFDGFTVRGGLALGLAF